MTHIKEIHVNVILKRYQYYTIFICSLNMLSYIGFLYAGPHGGCLWSSAPCEPPIK